MTFIDIDSIGINSPFTSKIHTLNKLYVEITGRCNLKCRMCLLNALTSPLGLMPLETFRALVDQLKALPKMPMLHFAGYGEPTSHPDFIEMVRIAKEAGAEVGITTNGTLLTESLATEIVKLKLDRIVVSIDGVKPEHYQDIRLGSMLPVVLENLERLKRIKIRYASKVGKPKIGIAFVAMKRNLEDLSQLPHLAMRIGATEIIVSNVIPYTAEMESEILYEKSLTLYHKNRTRHLPEMSIPKMDVTLDTVGQFYDIFQSHATLSLLDANLGARDNYCRFIQDGYSVVRWDGEVSPCLQLMHEHDEYIKGRCHHIKQYGLGNINETPFSEIWYSDEYTSFRHRVSAFEFSPCTSCARCDYFATNREDCMEKNPFPVCGGCLWARGLIQCP